MTVVRVNIPKPNQYLTSMDSRLHSMLYVNYLDNKKGYMSWKDIETLYKEGHDIGSHSMNHAHLEKLSKKGVSFEVAQSKKCFEDHGINATSFAYPFNEGS